MADEEEIHQIENEEEIPQIENEEEIPQMENEEEGPRILTADEISRIVRTWKVVMKMLHYRGYEVTDSDIEMTEDTLIEKYGTNVNRKQLEIKKVMCGNSSEQIYVFFLENLRFGMADIKDYIKRMANDSVHKAIFVVQSNVTSFLRRFINESTHYQLEVFLEAELLINITEHVLVPEHRVLTAEQKKTLLERYTIKEEQIPRIYITDPVARYYGLKHGQVVQIIRSSETAGRYCNYRYVVKSC